MSDSLLELSAQWTPQAASYTVPQLGLLRVEGQDAVKVLGGLCTANVTKMPEGAAVEAFFTDDRGRVLVHAMIARDSAGAWIVGQIPDPAALAAHIDRFIFREDAAPRDVTNAWCGRLIDGSEALGRLAAAMGREPLALESLDLERVALPQVELTVMRLPITSPQARLCLVPAAQQFELDSILSSAGFDQREDAIEFESRRVLNFWPSPGHEISERTLPQELDRDERAISFNKGCYLGQETVARLDALGEVQRKLCLVRIVTEQEIAGDESLHRDGKEVGKLTSLAPLPVDGSRFALAMMRRGSFAVGSEFQLRDATGFVVDRTR